MARIKDYTTIAAQTGLFIPVWDDNTDQQKKISADGVLQREYSVSATSDMELTSDVTLQDDAELFINNVPIGQYLMLFNIAYQQPDGTGPNGIRYLFSGLSGARAAASVDALAFSTTATLLTETTVTNASTAVVHLSGLAIVDVSVEGTVRFRWRQNTSSANRSIRKGTASARSNMTLIRANI